MMRFAGKFSDGFKAGKAEAYEDAAKTSDSLANEERQCASANSGHDDRWCAQCEAMQDAYCYAADKIRARAKELK